MTLSSIKVRLFSNDQYVLDKVLYSNFYRLKPFPEGSTVIDVGAHAGYFAIGCVFLGAENIHCYEALRSNFEILAENTKDFRPKIEVNNSAVMFIDGFLDVNIPQFDANTKTHDFNSVEIEQDGKPFDRVPCFSLDSILDNLQEDSVRLLKISIGGNELDILKNSKNLSKVEHICGETIISDPKILSDTIDSLKAKGFAHSWFSNTDEGTRIFIFSKGDSESQFNLYNAKE